MAQLKSGSTVGGNSILTTASSVGFPSGTVMVFHQASAPTGWTKSIANNDKALRVVSGTGGGTGGTHGLSSPPSTSHTHSTPSHSHSHSLSAGAHTLSVNEMPGHTHTSTISWTYGGRYGWGQVTQGGYQPTYISGTRYYVGHGTNSATDRVASNGGGASHSHALSGSITNGGSGTSGSAGPTAFSPQYIDVIVASKD